jgi:hypothetical protein
VITKVLPRTLLSSLLPTAAAYLGLAALICLCFGNPLAGMLYQKLHSAVTWLLLKPEKATEPEKS